MKVPSFYDELDENVLECPQTRSHNRNRHGKEQNVCADNLGGRHHVANRPGVVDGDDVPQKVKEASSPKQKDERGIAKTRERDKSSIERDQK